jgi:alkanesulfonate monooxygenase SsuD/methylene tetrahydromethanopterin reductase-like flavin-dependent oxidoreductase (luciferase family)
VEQAGINPLPVQRPIPLWMGGMTEPVIQRIARVADGWFPQFRPGPDSTATIERLRSYIRDAGRNIEDVGIEGRISMFNTPEAEWSGALAGWRELGASHVTLNTMNAQLASPQAHLDAIRRFIEIAT